MPTPRTPDEELLLAWKTLEAYRDSGSPHPVKDAAEELGLDRRTVTNRVDRAKARGLHLSPGAQQTMRAANLNGIEIGGGWKHVYDDDGNKIETVRWSAPREEITLEDFTERVAAAFADIPVSPPVIPPEKTEADLLSLYALFDVHFGMKAWGAETGGDDYDIKLATGDLRTAFNNVMAWTPDSDHCVLLIGGDFFHADDDTAQTPRNRHVLDVDGRMYKVLGEGIEVIAHTIEALLGKHKTLHLRVLRGNHDEHSHMVLSLALAQRYREAERVTVDTDPRDIFMHQWGRCMIAAHHGDKAKAQQLVMTLAEICPFWSESPHRIVFTGHVHHEQSKEFPGIRWESLRAFCPPDAFGARFAPRRAMQAVTFHKQSGVVLRAFDPIERR